MDFIKENVKQRDISLRSSILTLKRFNDNLPTITTMKFPLRQLPSGLLPPRQLPLNNFPWTTILQTITPMKFFPGQLHPVSLPPKQLPVNIPRLVNYPQTTAPIKSPPLTTIETYFELSRFESELHLSEASVATGYPIRASIVNP